MNAPTKTPTTERALTVPALLVARFDLLVDEFVAVMGGTREAAETLVAQAIVKRGIESLEAEPWRPA